MIPVLTALNSPGALPAPAPPGLCRRGAARGSRVSHRFATMDRLFRFAQARPGAYLAACMAAGLLIRMGLAHGDWALFLNPFWPLF